MPGAPTTRWSPAEFVGLAFCGVSAFGLFASPLCKFAAAAASPFWTFGVAAGLAGPFDP